MFESAFSLDDSIVALASPWGQSALAVVRTSGKSCLDKMSVLFPKKDMREVPTHTLHHSLCVDPQTGDPIDEVIVGVYRAPRSYTGEDSAEIMCHGSPVIVGRILSALSACGFRSAQPGEFTLRAFLNGKMGLTQAEAVNEIVRSKTDQSRSLALSRLGGTIERRICSIKQHLIGILATIEVSIDYADEDYGEGADAGDQHGIWGGKWRSSQLEGVDSTQ